MFLKTLIRSSILILLLFLSPFLRGQAKHEQERLSDILNVLEVRFSCHFNYASETTEKVVLLPPKKEWNLQRTITYLEKESNLKFTTLKNNFISIEPQGDFVFCGFLKDSETKEPIFSATINTNLESAITNAEGYFQLELNGQVKSLEIRHLGYKTIILSPPFFSDGNCKTILLNERQNELEEIIVTDYLTVGIDKLRGGVYQINFSDFGILPGLIETDVLQTIQALPGVQSSNETVSDINIRGGTNDQNLLIWDGIKMYQSGHFFGLISIYNPMITPNARLIKNGSAVEYTDGVSGTIEMNTDATVNNKFKGSLGVDMMSANAFVDVPLGKRSSIQVAARNGLGNFIKTPTYNAYVNRVLQNSEITDDILNVTNPYIEFEFNDASLRWLYDIDENNKVRLNVIKVRNEMELNEHGQNNADISKAGSLYQNSFAGGFYYDRNWNASFKTNFQLYATDYKLKAINTNFLEGQQFLQENSVFEIGAKLNGFYDVNENLKLSGGYQFTETQITDFDEVDSPLSQLNNSESVQEHGLYAQMTRTSTDLNTSLTAGFRMNYIGKFNRFIFEPRLSFQQRFLNHFTLEILGEFKHQITSQVINFQNDFLGIEKRRWQLSNNADIPIITGKQLSLGVHWTRSGWLVSGEGFYKHVSGITSQSQGFLNQFEFLKAVGNYSVYGLDFLIRKKWDKHAMWLSYSNMENHYLFDAISSNVFPNNLEIYNTITFGSSYVLGDFKLSGGFNWHTGKPTTRPVNGEETIGGAINYGVVNSDRLQDYFRVDISSTYNFKLSENSEAQVGFSIWNMLDKNNSINNYYRLDSAGNPFEEVKYALKFTPNLNFSVTF